MLKSILSIAITLLLTCTAAAERSEQWGSFLDHIATLTWAEKNCSGRASDAVRELRLWLRKHRNPEFEEALIRVETDKRESIDDSAPVLGERGAIDASCLGISRVWGEGGKLPGLWTDNRPRLPRASRPAESQPFLLSTYGEFAQTLAVIHEMKGRCDAFPSALAHAFTKTFIAALGEKEFRRQAHINPNLSKEDEASFCEAINKTYGPDAKEWPTLWYSRSRLVAPETASSEASDAGKRPSPIVASPKPKSSFRHGVIRRASGDEAIAPFSVKTNPGANYFIKLVRHGDAQELIAGFIVGGQPFSTRVPAGIYELRYAVGQDWINEQEYFGPKTAFYRADKFLVFSIESDRALGSEIELILQRGGNLRTSTIGKDKF